MLTLTIRQGEDCTIVVGDIADDDDQPVDVTGWSIHAMARPSALSSQLWQEWATSPTGTQATAQVVDGEIELDVPRALSTAWTWTGVTGVLHVEATEPSGGQRRARVGECRVYLDPEAVRP